MELYNQHTAAQDACYVSKYIPLDNPTFHLMTAIQHELHHNHQVNLSALQVPVWGHLTKYLQFGLLDSSFIWFRNISTIRSTFFTSSCLWSFDKIFTIWTIGFIIHLVQDYLQPSTELGDIHEELKNGCVHYDTTTCSIQEKWFT